MKVQSVAALTALGMLLTSVAVHSLTPKERAISSADSRPDSPRGIFDGAFERASFTRDGALAMEGRLAHTRLALDRDSETFLLVNVRADERARGTEVPRHLSIVIDRSGSMQGKRLSNALAAAQSAVARLRDGDVVSVIEYSGSARELIAPTTLDRESRRRVGEAILELSASGDTCISCALERSAEAVGRRSGTIDRVLLLSDGEATAGVRDLDGMRRVAERVRAAGATVTTIGMDVDYNERMMAAIAQETNGRHYFVETPEGLARIFDTELSGLERAVARDARLEIELEPGVELDDIVDRSFSREGTRVTVPLGAFSAGEERSVLARLRVRGGKPGEHPVLAARLVFDDLDGGTRAEQVAELALELTSDGPSSPLDPIVKERIDRSGTVAALDEASRLFERGDAAGARRRVAEERAKLGAARSSAVAAAPATRKAELDRDFARQEAALGAAESGFAEPPPTAASADDQKKGKVALKRNQTEVFELSR